MGKARGALVISLLLVWGLLLPVAPSSGAQQTEPVGVYIDRGILAYDEKNYDEALKNFLEAFQIDPENAEVRYFVGITSLALDQTDEAIVHLEKAAGSTRRTRRSPSTSASRTSPRGSTSEPRWENLGYYLGFIHFSRKEYERALRYFEENVSSDVCFQQQNRFYIGRTAKLFEVAIAPTPAPRRYRIELRGGASYDDNAPLRGWTS